MNSKNILLSLFILFFIVNAYAALTDENEEDYSSNDKFEELIMTSTLPPKSLPTIAGSKTIPTKTTLLPTVSVTKTLPTQTSISNIENEDDVLMKETVYTLFSEPYFFYNGTTTIPADVDDVYATCRFVSNYRPFTEPHPPRYYCDYDMNCFTFRNNFNITYISSTRTFLTNCSFFTKRNDDPKPIDTENAYITSICTPILSTYTSTLRSKTVTLSSTTIRDKEQTNLETRRTSEIISISTTEIVKSYTICSTKKPEPTRIIEPHSKPYDDLKLYKDEELDDPNKVLFITDLDEEFSTKTLSLPSEVVDYAIDCHRYVIYPPKGLQRRTLQPKTLTSTTRPSKVLPSKTTPKTSSRSTSSTTTTPIPDISYCLKDDYCFGYYDRSEGEIISMGYTTKSICDVYTHKTNEPTRTIPCPYCNFSLCRPTETLYKTRYTDILFIYGTTVTNDNYITSDRYIVFSSYDVMKKTIFCKPFSDTITVPPSPTTETETVITTPPTKCLPITVTVTEREKITVTEEETVTITIPKDDYNQEEQDDSKCAIKWAQCGGQDFNGPTCCQSGSTCHEINKYYSQCI